MIVTKGTYVTWEDDNEKRSGMVQETYPEDVTLTLNEREMSRHGTPKDRALFILDEAGNKYLKLESEVAKKK